MTYLELVNATLRRLRREEVTSVSATSYSTLISDLVNLAKREVEDAWNWLDLMQETSFFIIPQVDTYTLTGYGERYLIHQVHDTSDSFGRIRPITQKRFRELSDVPNIQTGPAVSWRIRDYLNGDPRIQFWPVPSEFSDVTVYAKVAQVDLVNNTDVLTVPQAPVLAGAYVRALDERGEDGGTRTELAAADYRQVLSDAIAQDNRNRAHGHESDWSLI